MASGQPDEASIFNAARQIASTDQRAAYLNEACGRDSALRERVEKLLKAFAEESPFLEKPAPGPDETLLPTASGNDLIASQKAGLAVSFDEQAAVVIGDASQSVLRSLGNTLPEVPRVSLRESAAEGADPVQRPGSAEIPQDNSDQRYQLQGEIARGGMGAIIKGRDTDLGRDLAIKVLLDLHKDNPQVIQRFVEEAQIGGQLQHPGIAPIYELGQFADKRPFFAMKLVKGQTLSKLLADREVATDERGKLIGIFEQICQTMAYAHSRGVIHRDLKPANIMVGAFGEVQVMDWGLAKVLSSGGVADEKKTQETQQGQSIIQTMRNAGSDVPSSFGSTGSETQMGSVMGTPAYMPPEQALGEIDQMDERADVFGLGAILCEILTGKPPYVGDDGTQVYRMASRGKLKDAFMRLDDCGAGEDLIALTKHCLELDPGGRPRDAGVLAERVTGYLESVEEKLREAEVQRAAEAARADAEAAQADAERQRAEAESQRAEAESARASEERKRRQTSLMLAASVLLLIGLGGGGWLYMERQESNRQSAEADAQRQHAAEMQALAGQRDDQRKAAELARNVAQTAQQQADTEKINSLNMLADMQTERGLLAAREGQSGAAALWFANAATLTPHDLDRQRANHLRASSWLDEAIAPAAFLEVPEKADLRRIEFQPNGPLLLTVGSEFRVWDWRNETTLPWSERLHNVGDAVWSPDGQQIAVGFLTTVRILDPFSGNLLKQFRLRQQGGVLEWSPDGTRLAVGGRHVQIWNVSDQPVQESDWPHPLPVYGLSFNHNGTRLVTSGRDEFARVFAVEDASLPAPLYSPVDHAMPRYLARGNAFFWDDDRKLATVTPGSFRLVLRDALTGLPLPPDATSSNPMAYYGLAVSPDNRWVATASSGVSLMAVDGRTIELKYDHQLTNVRFSPDGQSLATTCWGGNTSWWPLYDMASSSPTVGSPITIPQMGTQAQCVFSHDGSCLAVVAGKQLFVWERSQSELVAGEIAWAEGLWKPRLSFDGQLVTPGVLHTTAAGDLGPRGRMLQVARVKDEQPAGPAIKLNGWLRDSCVCADSRTVAAATVDGATGALTVYDIASGTPVFPSIALPDLPVSVAARPEQSQVAVLCRNRKLLVIDTQQGEILFDVSHEGEGLDLPSRAAYSPDGTTLLTVISKEPSLADSVYVRNAQTGELRFPPLKPVLEVGPCRAIAFSPDSRLLATAVNGRNMVQVWDLTTGEKIGREMPHPGDWLGLFSVAFSPDGQRILTGHKDGRARLWDWKTGQVVGTPMMHPDEVSDAQFTLDGRHVVTIGRHASPRVWDVATGKLAVSLPQIVPPGGASSDSFVIAGDRIVVTVGNQYSVLDLSLLRQKSTDDLSKLLARAELASNRKLQLGELVPLVQAEWTARWEQWVATRQTPEEAAQSLALEFDEAHSESTRRAIAIRAMRFNLTEQLQRLRPNDPHLQIALALEYSRAGRDAELNRIMPKEMADLHPEERVLQVALAGMFLQRGRKAFEEQRPDDAHADLNRARTLLEAMLNTNPEDSSGANALAQLLLEIKGIENKAQWTVLTPIEMKSEGGATLTLLEDHSVLVSGPNISGDRYTLSGLSDIDVVTSIRLEVLPDPSLPANGPGRHESGNFQLAAFQLFSPIAEQGEPLPISINRVQASYAYSANDASVVGIIDENLDEVWHVWRQIGRKNHADFELAEPLAVEGVKPMTIVIKHKDAHGGVNLGRFRLLVSDDPDAYANAEKCFAAMKIDDPLAKLAAAYHLIGDQQALGKLLKIHPQAAVGIVDLTVAAGDWPRVIEAYSKLISDQTTDATPLSRRGAAYVATEQWELARADWLRAIELQPDLLDQAFDAFRNAEQWSTAAEFGQKLAEQYPEVDIYWVRVAPIVVLSNDQKAYAAFCNWITQQPAETAPLADKAIKACLLRPGIADLAKLSDDALAAGLDNQTAPEWLVPYAWGTRALLAYRTGAADSATQYIAKSELLEPNDLVRSFNQAVLAMAHMELNHPDEAKAALAEASQIITRLTIDPSNKGHHDLLIAEILFREAEATINGKKDSDNGAKTHDESIETPADRERPTTLDFF